MEPHTEKKLLLVEDDRALSRGITLALSGSGSRVTPCFSLAQAQALCGPQPPFDLILLDLNLPDGSGLDLLRRLRQTSRVPVILLTANDLEADVVAGLEAGADDYITKPFSLAILRARVGARLRAAAPPARFARGELTFDFDHMTFLRGGAPLELSKTEQRLLRCLVEHSGQTLPRQTLFEQVWGQGSDFVEENALSVTVKRLRGKLEPDPAHPRYIKTVYGIGYQWVQEP